jgi:hypothetical protein
MHGRFVGDFVALRDQFRQAPGLPFAQALSAERIAGLLDEGKVVYRDRVYNPCVTLWTFLSQVLSADQSCTAAVARLIAFRTAHGRPPCSADNSSYCQARQRLPAALSPRLVRDTGADLHRRAPASWRVQGRPVKIIDGSTVSMPDTPALDAAFGKPRNQRGLSGFPVARMVVLLCLATGAVLDAAIGRYRGQRSGELTLFRALNDPFRPGDIVLGDRLFCTYFDIARLRGRGVDVVFRSNAARRVDFRRGRRLGHDDHVVTWKKPTACPDWLSPQEYAALPDELPIREVRVRVRGPARLESLVVVTTLTDPRLFSRRAIAELFRQRWHAELDLRSIKTVLQMDVLRGRTPELVDKEVWMHLLAYNLLRTVMAAAAHRHAVPVRALSFKGAAQLVQAFHHLLLTAPAARLDAVCSDLLRAVVQNRVGDRPNRHEPRKRKRAAKPYPRLKRPRHEERNRLRRNRLT